MNYVPNKYSKQASTYSGIVTTVDGSLSSALSEINQVSSVLSVGKASANDLLTVNVIAGSEEIKSEISTVQSKLGSYKSLISSKARSLDELEKIEYENYLRALARKKKAASNNESTEQAQ